ncbi:MAG: toxin-antitoxin system YwqK family antitoxin [Agriterribacter sp.]
MQNIQMANPMVIIYFFSASGGITQSLYYYHGVLNGPLLEFWENGSLQTVGYYSSGKLEGLLKSFDSTGSLINVAGYTNGSREGPEIRFYSSGNVKLITFYFGDWENGVRREYKDSIGNPLKGEFVIKNGLPVTGKFYDNGVLTKTLQYDYEQLLKEREALNKKGGDHHVREMLSD